VTVVTRVEARPGQAQDVDATDTDLWMSGRLPGGLVVIPL